MKVLELDYKQLKDLGYNVQGWNEEYFESGQLMHISYYKAGKVVLFKNFYENGQCQNYIIYLDTGQCNLEVYFENGDLKHQMFYLNGKPKKITEFYPSGLTKINIEYYQELICVSSK
jgi:antitoxin component YwqK of YwqJK toxin-antitoxin module